MERLQGRVAPLGTLAKVQAIWEVVAGPVMAAEAVPTAEHEGTLTLTCASAVWAQELDLMAGELLERLNAELGAREGADSPLRRVRCRTG